MLPAKMEKETEEIVFEEGQPKTESGKDVELFDDEV